MKRVFTFLAVASFALLASAPAQAQLRWGIKGGANFTSASADIEKIKNENLTAFHIGPAVEFGFGSIPLAVEGSVLFAQKGIKFEPTEATFKELGDGFLKTNNIEVPIYAKYFVPNSSPVRLFVQAGPSFNFYLSHSLSDTAKNHPQLKDFKAERIGVNLNAGLGVEVLKFVQISAVYSASVTNDYTFKGLSASTDDFIKAKDKGFVVSATLLF